MKIDNHLIDSSNLPLVERLWTKDHGAVANLDWLHGLFKHSCKPNVVVFRPPHLNENYYLLLTNVKSGEELSIAYQNMDYFVTAPRSSYISHSFKFDCTCIACVRDIKAKEIDYFDYGVTLGDLNVSIKNASSRRKLAKWFKSQLQEILVVSKQEDHSRQLLSYLLHYLYPNMSSLPKTGKPTPFNLKVCTLKDGKMFLQKEVGLEMRS
ncbi:hypothetical protein ACFFRR_011261 [Megaselia abdita]